MTFRRSIPSLVMAAILVVAAVISLGIPDGKLAAQYLLGSYPSEAAALAVAGIFCWAFVIGIATITVVGSLRVATEVQMVQRRWTRATMFVSGGVIILAVGALHHSTVNYSMCCGSQPAHVVEAQQLAQSH